MLLQNFHVQLYDRLWYGFQFLSTIAEEITFGFVDIKELNKWWNKEPEKIHVPDFHIVTNDIDDSSKVKRI